MPWCNSRVNRHGWLMFSLRNALPFPSTCWPTGILAKSIAGGGYQSTLFKIVTDQAGVVGLIRRLHGLGEVLVSVRQAPEADYSTQT
jgi:hypothetical protein